MLVYLSPSDTIGLYHPIAGESTNRLSTGDVLQCGAFRRGIPVYLERFQTQISIKTCTYGGNRTHKILLLRQTRLPLRHIRIQTLKVSSRYTPQYAEGVHRFHQSSRFSSDCQQFASQEYPQ